MTIIITYKPIDSPQEVDKEFESLTAITHWMNENSDLVDYAQGHCPVCGLELDISGFDDIQGCSCTI